MVNLICLFFFSFLCIRDSLSGRIQVCEYSQARFPIVCTGTWHPWKWAGQKGEEIWVQILSLLCSGTSRKITFPLSHYFFTCPVTELEKIISMAILTSISVMPIKRMTLWDNMGLYVQGQRLESGKLPQVTFLRPVRSSDYSSSEIWLVLFRR